MNKILFKLSGLVTLLSIFMLFLTSIIERIIPKLGLIAFALGQGVYTKSDYIIDFSIINYFAVALIVISLGLCIYAYKKKDTNE